MGPLPRRRTLRLPRFDYSERGAYFVTVCAHGGRFLFGDVVGGEMVLSMLGHLVATAWCETPRFHPDVDLDVFVVMPNHVHGVLVLRECETRSHLSAVVRGFKARLTVAARAIAGTPRQVWQRGYYEHVARNNASLDRIRQYIIDNPLAWDRDPENPQRIDERDPAVGTWER